MIGRGTRLCPELFGPDDDKQEIPGSNPGAPTTQSRQIPLGSLQPVFLLEGRPLSPKFQECIDVIARQKRIGLFLESNCGTGPDAIVVTGPHRGGPRNSDSLLRWDPDQGEGVWNATEATELSC